jgi:hypothetical protein
MSQDNAHALVTLHVLALRPDGTLPEPLKALFRELSTVDLDRWTGLGVSPLVPVFVRRAGLLDLKGHCHDRSGMADVREHGSNVAVS